MRNIERELGDVKKRCRQLEAELVTAQSQTIVVDSAAVSTPGSSVMASHVQQLNEQIGTLNCEYTKSITIFSKYQVLHIFI